MDCLESKDSDFKRIAWLIAEAVDFVQAVLGSFNGGSRFYKNSPMAIKLVEHWSSTGISRV